MVGSLMRGSGDLPVLMNEGQIFLTKHLVISYNTIGVIGSYLTVLSEGGPLGSTCLRAVMVLYMVQL